MNPDRLARLVPSPAVALAVALLAIAAAGLFGLLAGRLRVRRAVRAPYTRKLFHIAVFSVAAGVHLQWGAPAVLVYGAVVAMVVLFAVARGEGYPLYEALARPSDAPRRTFFVIVPLATTALGGLTTTLLVPEFAAVGYLVAGWGDAVGEPVGERWGRHRFRAPSLAGVRATRSIEGSAAVLVAAFAAACAALLARGTPPAATAITAGAVAVASTVVEAVSHHGLDNFTVQVAAAGVAHLMLA